MLALSCRQPWAWLIVSGLKDVENRTWSTHYRGDLLIHAAGSMSLSEYGICHRYAAQRGVALPTMAELQKGGIVGMVNLQKCYYTHDPYKTWLGSNWFEGPYGWHLTDAASLPFIPCRGQLKLFTPVLSADLEGKLQKEVWCVRRQREKEAQGGV